MREMIYWRFIIRKYRLKFPFNHMIQLCSCCKCKSSSTLLLGRF